jgi:TolA-binding protein/thioredoxin-like negative regulator of GroEL
MESQDNMEAEEQAGRPVEEQQPVPEGEGVMPPEVGRVRLPLVGGVPFGVIGVLMGLSGLVFIVVLVLCVKTFHAAQPPPTSLAVVRASVKETEPAERAAGQPAADLLRMSYADLMDAAETALQTGDLTVATRAFRAASARDEQGLTNVLLARYRLACCLAAAGEAEEALSICEGLAAVSRPGDRLWRCAQVTAIDALSRQRNWPEFVRRLCLLRANSARYSDAVSLDRWLAYCRAMGRVRMLLPRLKDGGALYGRQAPAFGSAPFPDRPLTAADIVVVTGGYGDGTLETNFAEGELHLRSEGATLADVLQRIARETGLKVRYDGSDQSRIVASLDTSALDFLLEVVLGSVGLQGSVEGDTISVCALQPLPRSEAEGARDALWALREFLILFPESAQVPEAYYALAHIYMAQGRTKMALEQFDVLCQEFPRSQWTVLGHYAAGRAYHGLSDWARAESELVQAADSVADPSLQANAYLWAAHSEVELKKYDKAVTCFRRALANQVNEPLAPEILYSIAYCMDMSGCLAQEVEERYLEVRTRYPQSPYARQADYHLARRAFLDGRYAQAVTRYEYYLAHWPLDQDTSRDACRDLAVSYVRTGNSVRAVLLGQVMASSFGREPQFWEALPAVLQACEDSGLYRTGVELIDRTLSLADTPPRQWTLKVARAECLIGMKKYAEAQQVLEPLLEEITDPEVLDTARLAQVRLWIEQPQTGPVLQVCREVAAGSPSPASRARALALLGRYFEGTRQFAEAARAYAGCCPPAAEGSKE